MLFLEISVAYIYAWGLPSPRFIFSSPSSSTQGCVRWVPRHVGSLGRERERVREREKGMDESYYSHLLFPSFPLGAPLISWVFVVARVAEQLRRLEGALEGGMQGGERTFSCI